MTKPDLVSTIAIHMRLLAEATVSENDPNDMVSSKDTEFISRRVLEQLGVEARAKLLVEIMGEDVVALAKKMTKTTIETKMRKIVKST